MRDGREGAPEGRCTSTEVPASSWLVTVMLPWCASRLSLDDADQRALPWRRAVT
jgi:hypothetical protein